MNDVEIRLLTSVVQLILAAPVLYLIGVAVRRPHVVVTFLAEFLHDINEEYDT